MSFDPSNPCQGYNIKNPDDASEFFQLERDRMPPHAYANKTAAAREERFNACAVIKQYGHDAGCSSVVPFLAISYYDNFILTRDDIPVINKDDSFENTGIFIISCFFLAWKMIYPDELDTADFLNKLHADFSINHVDGMEYEIDRWLENRSCKRPITSLTFLEYFFMSHLAANVDESHLALIRDLATERAYVQQEKIEYTEFKPSILAATAILHSCELFGDSLYDTVAASILPSEFVCMRNLERALELHRPPKIEEKQQAEYYEPGVLDPPEYLAPSRSTTARPDIPQSIDYSSSSARPQYHNAAPGVRPRRPFLDTEPTIDTRNAFSFTRVPRRYDDAAPKSIPQGSVFRDYEHIDDAEAAKFGNFDFLEFDTEDSSIKNADTSSAIVGPAMIQPRFTETDGSIGPIATGDQTADYRSMSWPGRTKPFGNICRSKERRHTI